MAEDPYGAISDVRESGSLARRIATCAFKEGEPAPEQWTYDHRWEWSAAPGWGAAFASAEASGNPDPGDSDDVITDGMVLAEVQRIRS